MRWAVSSPKPEKSSRAGAGLGAGQERSAVGEQRGVVALGSKAGHSGSRSFSTSIEWDSGSSETSAGFPMGLNGEGTDSGGAGGEQ